MAVHKSATIHPTAIVHPHANIAEGCEIGAYSIIGEHVVLGKRNRVGPHAVIEGHTTLGEDNVVFQFASIGSAPQDLKFKGEPTKVIIGNKNTIREYVTIQPGTVQGNGQSTVGNSNLLMVGTHVGHDAIVGDGNVFANYCSLAGHVTVGNRVTVGGLAGIHQFVRVGDMAILGAGAMVAKDIPPFCMAHGDRARLVGLNRIGLKRNGVQSVDMRRLKALFRLVFFGGQEQITKLSARIQAAQHQTAGFPLGETFVSFLTGGSKRGITFPRRAAGAKKGDDDSED